MKVTKKLYLTFDVEPFWTNIPCKYDRSHWFDYKDDSEYWTNAFIDYCETHNLNCTFFIVGKWAEMHPDTIIRMRECRLFHLGSHSFWHEDMAKMSDYEFLQDVKASKEILEDITRSKIIRFRAPSFSIMPRQFTLLERAGFLIDSSISNASRIYGRHKEQDVFGHSLNLFPMNGFRLFGQEVTILGGGYLRLLPTALLNVVASANLGNMVYLHPHDLPTSLDRFSKFTRLENLRKLIRIGSIWEKLDILRDRYAIKNF